MTEESAYEVKPLYVSVAPGAIPQSAPPPEEDFGHAVEGLVNRLLRVLPPRGLRPCFKRSLLLLDLWSRCGLEPRLHLGLRRREDRREGHAWITVADRPDLSAGKGGYTEAFVWEGVGTRANRYAQV